jgi:hypothetical protein
MAGQMAREGSIKKVFPGGNTSKGFVSFYDYIIKPDANKIFIIKGGPGVGKSTFMRKIAHELVELGLEVEFMCCSSDNGSLDGVVIPAIETAIIDGTAPQSAVAGERTPLQCGVPAFFNERLQHREKGLPGVILVGVLAPSRF